MSEVDCICTCARAHPASISCKRPSRLRSNFVCDKGSIRQVSCTRLRWTVSARAHVPACKMWQVSTRSRWGRGAVSTQKFGAVFKNLGHSNILGQTLPPNNIQNVALPVLRLPQTREAAPNGAACCPFGAGFGLPQLSRQRSCHALHTGARAHPSSICCKTAGRIVFKFCM